MKRAFQIPVVILVDTDEANPTLEQIKNYCHEALNVEWDIENCGNPCGILSINKLTEEAVELSNSQVERLCPDKGQDRESYADDQDRESYS